MLGENEKHSEKKREREMERVEEKVRIILLFVHQSTFSLCSVPVCVYWEFTFSLEMVYFLVVFLEQFKSAFV